MKKWAKKLYRFWYVFSGKEIRDTFKRLEESRMETLKHAFKNYYTPDPKYPKELQEKLSELAYKYIRLNK